MIEFIKIDIKLKDTNIKPPMFLGSALRGAFGVALKKVVCINPSYQCDGCFAKDNCLYYNFYEEKNIPHKFRFETDLNQNNFDFSLYLFEDATTKLPYVLSAILKMLTEIGLMVNRTTFEIDKIFCNDIEVFSNNSFASLNSIKAIEFNFDNTKNHSVRLNILTPIRIKYQNRLLKSKPPLEIILRSIQNRVNELKGYKQTKLLFNPTYKEKNWSINFLDITRRSNRQKTKMQIGGVVGYIKYSNLDDKSLYYLKLGEILGVGKQTVFGLGKIKVEDLG